MILSEAQGYKMKIADAMFMRTAHDRRAVGHTYRKWQSHFGM